MDENIMETMVDTDDMDITTDVEVTSEDQGSSALPMLITAAAAGVGGFILGKKLKVGERVHNAKISWAKKILDKEESKNAEETESKDAYKYPNSKK